MAPTGAVFALLILAGTAWAQEPIAPAPTQRAPDTLEARTLACVGCHGEQGRGVENVYFPRLAGKPAGYLYNQLIAFQEGRRRYAPMNYLLAYLPPAYLKQMADYFAAQSPDPLPTTAPNAPAAIIAQGQQIVAKGLPDKKIPACVACHGSALGGREPAIPGLLGLRADYVSAQLGAWRYGTRTALAPDCMQVIASTLSEAEVGAVAAYLATQQIPSKEKPAAADTTQLPLACGSQQPQEAKR
ncbi:c-type cytochrome [Duganella callida]|uniref:C-type cytochrome n=1 Tax=Duganella callida TaxID=2561932 RepID=A0A4Y9SS15_9BURK|nr:c-type cytochrome [Duganella callida]TFW27984.1 c-type cytochrome [Duganella callida]